MTRPFSISVVFKTLVDDPWDTYEPAIQLLHNELVVQA